jgi:hypothetical protein
MSMKHSHLALIELITSILIASHWLACGWAGVHSFQKDDEPWTWVSTRVALL